MQRIRVFVLSAMAAAAAAQETRIEKTQPSLPADDSKPNSANVPDVYAINTRFERIVILRFKYQADLLDGLERMVKAEKIRNAVILSGIGSVRSYHYHTVSNRTFPSKNVFVKNPTASADLASMDGHVIGGRIHAHLTMTEPGKTYGGHLEPGTTVFTFAAITLGVLPDDVDLSKLDDKSYR